MFRFSSHNRGKATTSVDSLVKIAKALEVWVQGLGPRVLIRQFFAILSDFWLKLRVFDDFSSANAVFRRKSSKSSGKRQNPSANGKILGKMPKSLGKRQNLSEIVRILRRTPISFGKHQNPSENGKILRRTPNSRGKRQIPTANGVCR